MLIVIVAVLAGIVLGVAGYYVISGIRSGSGVTIFSGPSSSDITPVSTTSSIIIGAGTSSSSLADSLSGPSDGSSNTATPASTTGDEVNYPTQSAGSSSSAIAINLSAVSPNPISVGGNLVLTGSGFFGNDTLVWISNGSVQGVLWEGPSSSDTSINAAVPFQACTQDEGNTGLQCPSYLVLSPGIYTVSVSNQNGTTDQVYVRIQ